MRRVCEDDVMRREYAQTENDVRIPLALTGQNVRHDSSMHMVRNYCGAGGERAHTVSRKTQGKHGKSKIKLFLM